MRYRTLLLFLFLVFPLLASDRLIEALSQGKFSGEIDARYASGSDEEGQNTTAHQTIFLEYALPPIKGVDIALATQSVTQNAENQERVNKIFFGEARYESKTDSFDYRLSANYYSTLFTPNEETQTVTAQALGFKAAIDLERVQAYAAVSKVSDSDYTPSMQPSLKGRDKLLPTASLLLSNNDAPNTRAAALDVKYAFHKELAFGSRYSLAEDEKSMHSYNGIYTSFMLNEVVKGLNLTLSFDQALQGEEEKQWSLQFQNRF